ncbi:Inner membrane component of T3SS domain-containing protein [Abditibacterium utsteinense]|uniref:Inner membrane component of T3SS domain-containing protein n=1 Tax=Abditibacterium utsteinense TaxID=1960156 RepID=A0A2S8SUU2_9BACT|nr:FHA domain-containing protein [Abditibacterium utsteinense]PQV64562.1 Inner membrane component of T3SS domain-containing protein [Abditibacterium utsteinense]
MLICPACQHQNIDGTQFCEMCGEELPQKMTAASPEDLLACPQCGHQNPSDNLACEACGADLKPGQSAPSSVASMAPSGAADPFASIPDVGLAPPLVSSTSGETTPFDAPANPALSAAIAPDIAALPAGNLAPGKVKLVVEQGQSVGAQFVLGDAEMLVGREDEDEEIYPDIDLSDQDAGYVHRKHATLHFENGNLSVTHLGGSNKTRINNKPVADNAPTPVNLGDKIAFGKVVLRLLPV